MTEDARRFESASVQRIGEIPEKIFKVTSYGDALHLPPLCGLRLHWDGGETGGTQYINRFANKGTALSDLQMRLAISGFETACIGDSVNDIPMMRNAKLSYCVGRRSEELYGVCNHRVDRIETALWELIEE